MKESKYSNLISSTTSSFSAQIASGQRSYSEWVRKEREDFFQIFWKNSKNSNDLLPRGLAPASGHLKVYGLISIPNIYTPSFCPDKIRILLDKIFFVPDKIFFVPDKIFFVLDKIFFVPDKIIFVLDKTFLSWTKIFVLSSKVHFCLWNRWKITF